MQHKTVDSPLSGWRKPCAAFVSVCVSGGTFRLLMWGLMFRLGRRDKSAGALSVVDAPSRAEARLGSEALAGSANLVEMRGVRKVYETPDQVTVTAAADVDLDVARGEVVALMGPSGSGKSTLLHLLGALDRPDSGTITVEGVDITSLAARRLPDYRRSCGFVFQQYHLLPTLSLLDNVLAPSMPYGIDGRVRARAQQLLVDVGLGTRSNALPSRLSGGQQQRVAIARALLGRPRLLLADEPTGNLDSLTGEGIIELILGLRDSHGATVVLATHDASLADRCDRVVQVLDGHVQ